MRRVTNPNKSTWGIRYLQAAVFPAGQKNPPPPSSSSPGFPGAVEEKKPPSTPAMRPMPLTPPGLKKMSGQAAAAVSAESANGAAQTEAENHPVTVDGVPIPRVGDGVDRMLRIRTARNLTSDVWLTKDEVESRNLGRLRGAALVPVKHATPPSAVHDEVLWHSPMLYFVNASETFPRTFKEKKGGTATAAGEEEPEKMCREPSIEPVRPPLDIAGFRSFPRRSYNALSEAAAAMGFTSPVWFTRGQLQAAVEGGHGLPALNRDCWDQAAGELAPKPEAKPMVIHVRNRKPQDETSGHADEGTNAEEAVATATTEPEAKDSVGSDFAALDVNRPGDDSVEVELFNAEQCTQPAAFALPGVSKGHLLSVASDHSTVIRAVNAARKAELFITLDRPYAISEAMQHRLEKWWATRQQQADARKEPPVDNKFVKYLAPAIAINSVGGVLLSTEHARGVTITQPGDKGSLVYYSLAQTKDPAHCLRFLLDYKPIDAATGSYFFGVRLDALRGLAGRYGLKSNVWVPTVMLGWANIGVRAAAVKYIPPKSEQRMHLNGSRRPQKMMQGVAVALVNADHTTSPGEVEAMANYTPRRYPNAEPYDPRQLWSWKMKAVASIRGYRNEFWVTAAQAERVGTSIVDRTPSMEPHLQGEVDTQMRAITRTALVAPSNRAVQLMRGPPLYNVEETSDVSKLLPKMQSNDDAKKGNESSNQ